MGRIDLLSKLLTSVMNQYSYFKIILAWSERMVKKMLEIGAIWASG